MREEVRDRYGNVIYLTDERWRHIVKAHPQLNSKRAVVLSVIRSGKRRRDPGLSDKYFYTKPFAFPSRFKVIEVVVFYSWQNNQPNNFVITAYPK